MDTTFGAYLFVLTVYAVWIVGAVLVILCMLREIDRLAGKLFDSYLGWRQIYTSYREFIFESMKCTCGAVGHWQEIGKRKGGNRP